MYNTIKIEKFYGYHELFYSIVLYTITPPTAINSPLLFCEFKLSLDIKYFSVRIF
jgi:hypothetical protein